MTDLLDRNLPSVSIGGTEIHQIAYKGEPVVTFAMVDEVHQRPSGTARRSFNENRERFVEGVDFVELTSDEIRTMSEAGVFPPRTARGTILTQRGYLKLTKPVSDDRAWQVQGEMVDSYFAVKNNRLPTTAEGFASVFAMVADQERRQAVQDQQIKAIEAKVDQVAQTQLLTSKPQNAETITEVRQRINRRYGLSKDIVNTVMSRMTYSPKPAGMLKNEREEAKGSTYAVYWIRDVTQAFKFFVDECRMATVTQATHPHIEGRFKLTGKADA